GLALGDQELEALVGVLAGAEAGDLAHGPEPAAIHRRIGPARERIAAGQADVLDRRIGDVGRGVGALDRDAAGREELLLALGLLLEEGRDFLRLPARHVTFEAVERFWIEHLVHDALPVSRPAEAGS